MKSVASYSLFLLLLISSGAEAQIVWKESIPLKSSRYQTAITALSSFENTVYAVGIVQDHLFATTTVKFFRTENGGRSWRIQDTKINTLYNYPRVRWFRIQQIDNMNITAIVDTGIILRTFDGGESWDIQTIEDGYRPNSIHFSDSLNGIVSVFGNYSFAFTTKNGGRTWEKVNTKIDPFPAVESCRSYGNGKYRQFHQGYYNIYTTLDNWKTHKVSEPVVDENKDTNAQKYYFYAGKLTDSDTVFAFGGYKQTQSTIARSTDAGKTWSTPYVVSPPYSGVTHMTQLKQDTMYACGYLGAQHYMLFSSDRGATWRVDTLLLSKPLNLIETFGIEIDASGRAVAAFSSGVFYAEDTTKLKVEASLAIDYYAHIYPNPASTQVTIEAFIGSREVQLIDMLGRSVLSGITSHGGKITFDISTLPMGVYGVLVNRDGGFVSVGKVAVSGIN